MTIELIPVTGLPEVRPGDVIADLVASAFPALVDGDVVVVTQKIVSKAEGRLEAVDPDEPLAHKSIVERESRRILRRRGDLVISETPQGFVCANAGVDQSNVPGDDAAVLLPLDPDASARELRARLPERPGVIISDTFGRAWRVGQVEVAIGIAGVQPLEDWRGRPDAEGRVLAATQLATADAIAAASELARAKDSREPVVIVSGLGHFVTADDGPGAAALIRARAEDLFR